MKRKIAIGLAVVLLSAGIWGQAAAQAVDPVLLRPAIIAQERNNPMLLALPGVVGTAVGVDAQGDPVVKVYTTGGAVRGLPSAVDGIPVRMEVTGQIFAFQSCTGPPWTRPPECNGGDGGEEPPPDDGTNNADPTSRFRPVPIGVSTGHPDITAGTICCLVTDSTKQFEFALSNNHVYADQNRANLGDTVLQPGSYDGGKLPDDAIGTLADFQLIIFSRQALNEIDAAIAAVEPNTLIASTPSGGYCAPRSNPVAATPGMNVQKFGRSTSLTTGWVDAINATVQVRFDQGFARFVGQIVIRPGSFSAPGDSGSLIVTDDEDDEANCRPVGLLFAGSSSVTIANPIDKVLGRFGLTIVSDPGC